MGTLSAATAIAAAFALVFLPGGSAGTFVALGLVFVALAAAAILRAQSGWLIAATTIGGLGILVATPFVIGRREMNALSRAARQDEAGAQALIDFYQTLEPFAPWLLALLVTGVVALFVIGARRAGTGAHAFLLDESDALARFAVRVGTIASLLYVPMILIIVYDVLQRKYLELDPAFTRSAWYHVFTSTKLQEMEWHLHAALFLMCFAFAYIRDAHVRIELVRERLGPRTRVWIELAGCLLFLIPYCYVVLLYGYDFAQKSFAILEQSSAQTGLEFRFIIKSFLPAGFTLLAIGGVSVALKCVVYLFGPPELRDRASYYAGVHHADMPGDGAPESTG